MLTIQFGQCGNQLGHALFSKISSDMECVNTGVSYNANYQYSEDTFNKWFNGISKENKRLARTILVDTEQKVINTICNDTTIPWTYWTKNVVCQAGGGCANNWAYGYLTKAYELSDIILNSVRQEVEKMDHFDGFLLLLSSAGGTGSGIGSSILELLREEYKTKPIITTTILPFSYGEVCTQNYNTLLTLAKLCNQSDINIVIQNEQIYNICTNLLKKSTTQFQDINEIISEKLLAVFQPVNHLRYSVHSLVSQIASHPSYKLATIKSIPHVPKTSSEYEPTYNWNSYIHHLKQTLRTPNLNSELTDVELKMPSSSLSSTAHHAYTCSISNFLITRGTTTDQDFIMTNEFSEKYLYANWNTIDCFSHLHQKRKLLNYDKFLALITNNSQISGPLDTLLSKTWNSYVHAAYLHQYKKFGLEDDDFLQAFAIVENVVKEYKELVAHRKARCGIGVRDSNTKRRGLNRQTCSVLCPPLPHGTEPQLYSRTQTGALWCRSRGRWYAPFCLVSAGRVVRRGVAGLFSRPSTERYSRLFQLAYDRDAYTVVYSCVTFKTVRYARIRLHDYREVQYEDNSFERVEDSRASCSVRLLASCENFANAWRQLQLYGYFLGDHRRRRRRRCRPKFFPQDWKQED